MPCCSGRQSVPDNQYRQAPVTPAKAGVQRLSDLKPKSLGPCLRRDDELAQVIPAHACRDAVLFGSPIRPGQPKSSSARHPCEGRGPAPLRSEAKVAGSLPALGRRACSSDSSSRSSRCRVVRVANPSRTTKIIRHPSPLRRQGSSASPTSSQSRWVAACAGTTSVLKRFQLTLVAMPCCSGRQSVPDNQNHQAPVTPAKAGVQRLSDLKPKSLGPCLRRDDELVRCWARGSVATFSGTGNQ
jgi:hypothetical protein